MSKTVAVLSKHSGPLMIKLNRLLPLVHFIQVEPSDPSPLEKAEIILGDYDLVGPHLYDLPKVKWVQGTWAGLDQLWPHIKKEGAPGFPITRTSGDNFGRLMGEYVLGNIIFWERNFFKVRENQKDKNWDRTVCPHDHRTIGDLKIGILGIGSIGTIIGKTLHYLGAKIYGFGRSEAIPLECEDNKHISKYFAKANLASLLTDVDYIVNILPHTLETNELLGNGILKNCKDKNVVFINIGRGNVIKEPELIQALEEKWLIGAVLDVFQEEPLPKTSKLWSLPNVFITPHIAGNSRAQDIAEKFKINLERFERNEPLINRVDFTKGY